jgi:hypothetical protein
MYMSLVVCHLKNKQSWRHWVRCWAGGHGRGNVRCSTLLCTALAWQFAVQVVERIYQALRYENRSVVLLLGTQGVEGHDVRT